MWTPDLSIIITAEQKAAAAAAAAWAALRSERDRRLAQVDWLVTRHAQETLATGATPTLTPDLFDALFVYSQALRDLPANTSDPASPIWPEEPFWLSV